MTTEPSAAGAAGNEPLPAFGFLLLFGLTIFWGANWPAMKIVLGEMPVWSFRTICLAAGGTGLLSLAALGGLSLRVPRAERGPLLLCALFNMIGWHLCTGYGLSLIPAGRAAIIAFTMPLWAALLGSLLLGEKLTPSKLIGLALGMAGLAALIGGDLQVLGKAPLGSGLVLTAALSWALGTVLIKRFTWSISNTTLVGWQLLAAALPVSIGALLMGDLPVTWQLSGNGILALIYVIALPMLFCQWAYFKLVRIFPAVLAAIGTLAIPVVGVFSSALILGEAVGLSELLALALVCTALAVVLLPPALRRRQKP